LPGNPLFFPPPFARSIWFKAQNAATVSTILVIDSSPAVQETLRIVLRGEHQVTVARSFDAIAELDIAALAPDLAVLGFPAPPPNPQAIANALAPLRPDVPLLVLNAPSDVDPRELLAPGRRVDFLPKPFDAYALRARVRAMLRPPPAPTSAGLARIDHLRTYLEPPFLPRAAAAVVRQALTTDLPLLLTGEVGTGAPELARAIHAFSGRSGPFTTVRGDESGLAENARRIEGRVDDGTTLFVERVHLASPASQRALLGLLTTDVPPDGPVRVRVLASTTEDLLQRASAGEFLPELAYALTTVPVVLVPLRERPGDIPALVDLLTARVTARLRLAPVTYTESAMETLTRYLWFGNLAELEAAIARTLALHKPTVVQPSHLLFLPEDAASAVTTGPPRTAVAREHRGPTDTGVNAPSLEVMLGELAHELRNPMVTIKTFAQHIDSVINDPEVRERFSGLTVEAVDRMNDLLETLLDFARFRLPTPRATNVRQLLEDALLEQSDALNRKAARVEREESTPLWVSVDEAQVAFALRQLVVSIVHDLTPHEALHVATLPDGTLALSVRMEPTIAKRLAAWVEQAGGPAPEETPPLRLALAAALLLRNDGILAVRGGAGGTTVLTVTWPRAAREG